jgi:hypothetical protein
MERPPLSLDVNRRPKGAANEIKRRESVNTLQQKSYANPCVAFTMKLAT